MAEKRGKKRAKAQLSIESIAFIVLVVVVILAVTPLMTQEGREVMGSLFGIANALNISEEFVPYTDNLNTNDKLALYSIQALQFALEKTSSGEKINKSFCDDFETTQYITPDFSSKDKAVKYISDFIYNGCYLKYKEVKDKNSRFCGLINVAEMEKLVISEKDLKNSLDQLPEKPKFDIDNALFAKETISSKKGDICIYYLDGIVNIGAKSNENCKKIIKSSCPTVVCENGACALKTFYLPQEVGSQDIAKQWITGAGDPAYIVYYESFPKGEDSSWHISEMSFLMDVVMLGGVLNAIPGAFGSFKTILKLVKPAAKMTEELLRAEIKEMTEALSKQIGKEAAEELVTRVERNTMKLFLETSGDNFKYFKAGLIQDMFVKSLPDGLAGGDDIIKQVSARIMNEMAEKTEQQAIDSIPNAVREILSDNKVPKEIADQIAASFEKSAKDIIKLSAEDAIAQYTRKQAIRQFVDANLLQDGKTLIKEPLKKIFFTQINEEVMYTLSRESQEELTKSVKAYADSIIEGGMKESYQEVAEEGSFFAWKEILNTVNKDTITILDEGIKSTFKAFTQNIKDPNVIIGILTGVNPGTKYSLGGKFGFTKILGLNIPVFKPTAEAKTGLQLIASSINQPGKATGNLLWDIVTRSRLLKYGAALAIGHQLAIAESMKDKYKANGKDSIVLFQPFLLARNRVLKLDNVDYYINIERGQRYGQRLFFASPCKTDMTMKKTMCSCTIKKEDFIYNGVPFDKGTVPMKITPEEYFTKLPKTTGSPSFLQPLDYSSSQTEQETTEILPNSYSSDYERVYVYDTLPDNQKIAFAESLFSCDNSEFERRAVCYLRIPWYEVDYSLQQYNSPQGPQSYSSKYFGITVLNKDEAGQFIPNLPLPMSQKVEDAKNYLNQKALEPSTIEYMFLQRAYIFYYDLTKGSITKNMVKECKSMASSQTTQGILGSSSNEAKLSVKCVDVIPNMAPYNGQMADNYCFTPSTIAVDVINGALMVVNIAVDIAIGVLTLPAAPITVPVAGFVTGTITAWIQREVTKAKNWPMRGELGDISDTVLRSPIVTVLTLGISQGAATAIDLVE